MGPKRVLSRPSRSTARNTEEPSYAPSYDVPSRKIVSMEHPCYIRDLDKGLRTLGTAPDFKAILEDGSPSSVPLYLRYTDPLASPLVSHSAATHCVVVKVALPKRTGRKRKKGSDGPWEDANELPGTSEPRGTVGQTSGKLLLDDARVVRRKLQDNVGQYQVEAMGVISQTHRYRGMSDFQYSTMNSTFLTNFADKVLPGDVSKLREFRLNPGTSFPPMVDPVPPPAFTSHNLPFSYLYSQNPLVREVDAGIVNVTAKVQSAGHVIRHNTYPVPTCPKRPPDAKDPQTRIVIAEFAKAMEERPIWTRRSIVNRVARLSDTCKLSPNIIRRCIPYAGYQFNGGPWRDALVKYGVDPRKDPEMRIYQTLIFKIRGINAGETSGAWHHMRAAETSGERGAPKQSPDSRDSHIFDGQSYCSDGKVWQVCDITDPLLAGMFSRAEVRPICDDVSTGFYHQGLWAKAKAIMKSKIQAIRFGRHVSDPDYEPAMRIPDQSPVIGAKTINVPLPNLNLTPAELKTMTFRTYHVTGGVERRKRKTNYSVAPRVVKGNGGPSRTPTMLDDAASSAGGGDDDDDDEEEEEEEEEDEEEEVATPSAQLHTEMQVVLAPSDAESRQEQSPSPGQLSPIDEVGEDEDDDEDEDGDGDGDEDGDQDEESDDVDGSEDDEMEDESGVEGRLVGAHGNGNDYSEHEGEEDDGGYDDEEAEDEDREMDEEDGGEEGEEEEHSSSQVSKNDEGHRD